MGYVTWDNLKHNCAYSSQEGGICPKVTSQATALSTGDPYNGNGFKFNNLYHGFGGLMYQIKTAHCGRMAIAELAPGRWRFHCPTYAVKSENQGQVTKLYTTIYLGPNKDSTSGITQVAEQLVQTEPSGPGSSKSGSFNLDFDVPAGKQWMHAYWACESSNEVSWDLVYNRNCNLSKIG